MRMVLQSTAGSTCSQIRELSTLHGFHKVIASFSYSLRRKSVFMYKIIEW